MPGAWVLVMLAAGVASCGEPDSDPAGQAGAGAGGRAGGAGTGGHAGTGGQGSAGSPICQVDKPCPGTSRCLNLTELQKTRTVGCKEACGGYEPCSGGACVPDGPVEECPWGTTCREAHTSAGVTAMCEGAGGEGGAGGERDPTATCGQDYACPVADDPDCSASACAIGATCVEPSGLVCRCAEAVEKDCSAPLFIGLSLLDGAVLCSAEGLSADGTTVVGQCSVDTEHYAVTWTLGGGIKAMAKGAEAFAANGDGSVVVGARQGAFRANAAGFELLVAHGDGARDVSADGNVVVGIASMGAFRWTAGDGLAAIGRGSAKAFAVSADGAVLAGADENDEAVVWNEAGEARTLPTLARATESEVSAMSADGSVLVGRVLVGTVTRAVRWTDAGVETLGGELSYALDTTADGALVVGQDDIYPVLWDAAGTAREVKSLLEDAGADVSDWSIQQVRGISADGRVLVGNAIYLPSGEDPGANRAFVAYLP